LNTLVLYQISRTNKGIFYELQEKPKEKYGLIIADSPRFHLKKAMPNASELAYQSYLSLNYKKENIFILEGREKPKARFDANNLS